LCDTGGKTSAHTTSMSHLGKLWPVGIICGSNKGRESWDYNDYEVAKLVVGFFAMYHRLCDTGEETSAHTTSMSHLWIIWPVVTLCVSNKGRESGDYNDYDVAKLVVGFFA